MANTVANVSAGKPSIDGAIWRAPIGTTLPTDATTALDAAFACLGYVSEDGLTNSKTLETETVKAWGGDDVLTTQTDKSNTWQYTLIEYLNMEVLKMVYGDDNVTGTLSTGITVTSDSAELDEAVYVVELALRGGVKERIVMPRGSITEFGDVTYTDNGATGYPITLKSMPGGFTGAPSADHKKYIKQVS